MNRVASGGVEQQIVGALRREGRPLCQGCLTQLTGRSPSGVRAACRRLLAKRALVVEASRTCRRCRRVLTALYRPAAG